MANELVIRNGLISKGDITLPIRNEDSNYTLLDDDYSIVASGSTDITVTIPASATTLTGKIYIFKNLSETNNLTIGTDDETLIDLSQADIVLTPLQSIQLQTDGTQWIRTGQSGTSGSSGSSGTSGSSGSSGTSGVSGASGTSGSSGSSGTSGSSGSSGTSGSSGSSGTSGETGVGGAAGCVNQELAAGDGSNPATLEFTLDQNTWASTQVIKAHVDATIVGVDVTGGFKNAYQNALTGIQSKLILTEIGGTTWAIYNVASFDIVSGTYFSLKVSNLDNSGTGSNGPQLNSNYCFTFTQEI